MPSGTVPGVPPFPSFDLLGWPTTPNPPLLDPQGSEFESASRLADAFRGAVRSRFKVNAWSLPRTNLSASKHYKALVAAAKLLQEQEIAPAAWAAWSCDVWAKYNNAKKPPPVAWVFSRTRIEERHGWFASEESAYAGGKLVVGPRVRALTKLWNTMRKVIELLGAWNDPQPVVDHFFPERSYAMAVSEARREVVQTRERLRREVDMGGFVW